MKQAIIGLIVGVLLGIAATLAWPTSPLAPSPVLQSFSTEQFLASVSEASWQTIADTTTESYPPLSRAPRAARRVVARAILPESEQTNFAARFQSAAEHWLESQGATLKGQEDANDMVATPGNDDASAAELQVVSMPRRFYDVTTNGSAVHGVADFSCVQNDGHVTIEISLEEGR